MEGFTLIDGLVALVIVLSAILAYSRGLVREAMAIAGWVGAAVLAFVFAESAQPVVKDIPVLGDFLKDSCELSIIVALALSLASCAGSSWSAWRFWFMIGRWPRTPCRWWTSRARPRFSRPSKPILTPPCPMMRRAGSCRAITR